MGHGLYMLLFFGKAAFFGVFLGLGAEGDPRKGTCAAERACVSLLLGVVSLCLARGWGFIQRVAGFHAGG